MGPERRNFFLHLGFRHRSSPFTRRVTCSRSPWFKRKIRDCSQSSLFYPRLPPPRATALFVDHPMNDGILRKSNRQIRDWDHSSFLFFVFVYGVHWSPLTLKLLNVLFNLNIFVFPRSINPHCLFKLVPRFSFLPGLSRSVGTGRREPWERAV